jgi:hypothetical protein
MNKKNPLDSMDRFVPLLDTSEPALARLVERRDRRRRRRQVASGAAVTASLAGLVGAMVWVLPLGNDRPTAVTSAPVTELAAAAAATTEAPATTEPVGFGSDAAPPVEFTACNTGLDMISESPDEIVAIPTPDGVITVRRGRDTMTQIMNEVSDPRLDGTWRMAWNEDDYGGTSGADIVTVVWRIETDEGAWQGSDTWARHGDFEGDEPQFVLTGEGAYEGLTAILKFTFEEPCPNALGIILDLGVPEPQDTFPAG